VPPDIARTLSTGPGQTIEDRHGLVDIVFGVVMQRRQPPVRLGNTPGHFRFTPAGGRHDE
jgi:hypothetical protein